MQAILQDVRYALRQLRNVPGFTFVATATLALGIGANTAIYSIIHGALRLPYPNAERMVGIQNVYPQGSYYAVSYPDFLDWRARSKTLSPLVATFTNRMTWTGPAEPESLNVGLVSDGFLRFYGMKPILGRDFLSAEHQKGATPVCILVDDFWREQLGGNPALIGAPLNLNGKSCTIVGVMPTLVPQAAHPVQVWMPLEPSPPWDRHGTNYLFAIGRLRQGFTRDQAFTDVSGIQAQIDKQFPDSKHGIAVHPLSQAFFGDLRPIMVILLAAVGFILLIACVNLANMLLARAADRAREFAIRRALGASPRRMLQQVLSESLLLSMAGAALGLAIAEALTHIPIAAWPKGFTPPSKVHLDAAVLLFTAVLAVSTGVLFGIVPALRILCQDETPVLQPGRSVTETREQNRTRAILVVAEIALSLLLVAGALNMAIYFIGLLRVDPGVNPQNALALTVQLSPAQYAKPDDQHRLFQALLDKLSALPGVAAVGGSIDTPFTGSFANGDFQYEGQPAGTADRNPFAEKHTVTPGYFAALQTPILEGRDFSRQDQPSGPKVVLINRTMAQKLWPGQNPIGKHIKPYGDWEDVIGVVADIRFNGPAEPAGLQIYSSAWQSDLPFLTFVLRTAPGLDANPLSLAEPARRAVASLDPGQAVSNITSLQMLADEALAGQRTSTTVTAILGCLALLLASIGVYGVMAYSVSRREREFGIRMALGADRSDILGLLFSGVFRLVLAGLVAGSVLAITLRAWVASIIGASGVNPVALAAAALLLCLVAALATYVPGRRATRVEPMQALRTE